jgi:DMSO/TMAO reductase YedYZ heme-binding membrane subunit
LLSVLHYLWLDRDFITEPVIYGVIVGVLLALRLPAVRGLLSHRGLVKPTLQDEA